MKFLKSGLSLAVIGATIAVLPGTPSVAVGAAARADDPSPTARMRAAADGSVRVTTESATGRVGFVAARGAGADLLPDVQATTRSAAVAKADAYVDRFGSAFGASPDQLVQTHVQQDRYGWTVTYAQEYRGLPVFGSTIKANLDSDGDLTAVGGYAAPDLDLSTEPRLSAAEAGQKAVAFVKADPPTSEEGAPADTSGVRAVASDLNVYRLGALKGDAGEAVLAYVVEVSDGDAVRDMVFVDADTGKPVNRYSLVNAALDRELYETSPAEEDKVWEEGQPTDGLNQDQKNLVASAGEAYWLFKNTFGRDSYDGKGATMKTVNNDPRINCPNANWNGTTTNYCNGVTSDDVVSHEWGHAYTEYTSGLIYQYQSGALNESYSDVWGETLDLVNGREDQGEGDITATRPDGLCSKYTRGNIGATINSPASVAGPCAAAAAAAFGPVFDKAGVTTDVVVANDAANPAGPSTTDGCSAFSNAAAIDGKFAYVDRGTCTFAVKTQNAVAAGATGIVVGDSVAGRDPISMSGTADIYGVMVTFADGARIKSAGTVNMTIKDIDTTEKADSYRWLIGEKSGAFGGAIRDMWNPTCYGNPGKVSDAEYNCDPQLTDNGGVHGNSGVPNHAYALVVDGGTYNGETVAGIGLDKAANIWWKAQDDYLFPAADFTNAADALEQSCQDLVGEPINQVTTEPDATVQPAAPITAADCTSVVKAMVATEMRKDPVQCNFQPLLAPGQLSPCGSGTVTETTVIDDFESGLDAWTPEQELAVGATDAFPWEATEQAPGGRTGTVAYAPDPDEGSCAPGEDDVSSRDSIISPVVTVPAGKSPRVTFDHYVATEGGYDGGNVKASVNGGPFTLVPASAYLFNPYNATMQAAPGNTSPIAGQPGFTGTDGGEVVGSWGQSTVSLAKLGLRAGDEVELRFDFGRDGCGGNDGWYVDDLVLTVCKDAPTITARHEPQPSTYGTASTVEVSAPSNATGTVTLELGDETFGSDTLEDGAASIALPANAPAGSAEFTVSYSGDDAFGAAEVPVTITIAKAATSTAVTYVTKRVEQGERGTVRVRVRSAAGTPTGKVTLKRGGATFGTAVLEDGVAVVRTSKLRRAGSYVLRPAYLGGRNYAPSTGAPVTIRVVR